MQMLEQQSEAYKKQIAIEEHLKRVQKTLEFFKCNGWTDEQVRDTIGDITWRMTDPGIDPYYLRHPGQR